MKKITFISIILFTVLALALYLHSYILPVNTSSYPSVAFDGTIVRVELADEPVEWWQGLSGRESLGAERGMLFVFPEKQARSFWMKNMRFPLDIIWIADGRVVRIDRNLPPAGEHPEIQYSSVEPVNYVLEVNAGFAEEAGIEAGDRVEVAAGT